MTYDKDEEANELAQLHYEIEAGMRQIFRITESADAETSVDEPIKLLEVNEDTVPGGIMPLRFGPEPSSGIHFSSIIVEVTPDEFEKIQSRELPLPFGWTVGNPIPRACVKG
jgi:hypothetical protein